MKYILVATLLFSLSSWAQTNSQDEYTRLVKQSQKQYQAQDYQASLESLNQAKTIGMPLTSQWYYFSALNNMKLQNDEVAVENFNKYIDSVEPENSTRGYYFLGQIYTKQKKYEEALTHFELASDTSTDLKLDKAIDSSIERTLRLQRLNERNKIHNLALLLGYGYDDNAVNLNASFFEENLKGHAFNYGGSYSYLISNSANSRVEPTIAVVDSYTLDGKFKSNEVVQSKDALQINAVLPVQFSFSNNKVGNLYNLALSTYAVYLPLTSTKRELALTSLGVTYSMRQTLHSKLAFKYELNFNFDRSYGFTDENDDASGLRSEGKVGGVYDLSYDFVERLNGNIAAELSATKGANTKYRKYYFDIGFSNTLSKQLSANSSLQYYHLNYYEKSPVRSDNQIALTYALAYEISEDSVLDAGLKYSDISSTNELNASRDLSVSLQYAKVFSF